MNSKIIRISFIFISFIFFSSVVTAKNIEAYYSAEFGIVGEVARAHATLTSNGKAYTLDANIQAVGAIAKTVTDNLKERHISNGHIVNGLLVTDVYQMIKSYGVYNSTTIYRVDHKRKRVTRHYIKWKKGKEIINEKVRLGYYGKDDLMTLFMNLSKHIKKKYKSKKMIVTPIGGNGFIFGRGSKQFTPEIIRIVSRENIIIVGTYDKISKLDCLRVDTGDYEIDKLLSGHIKVVVGKKEEMVMEVRC